MLTSDKVGLVRGRDGVSAPSGLALHSRIQPKNEAIEAFITAIAAEPFAWGKTDCASIADRWVEIVRGFSPMDRYGRRHTNEAEALAWLAEPPGIAVGFNRVMRATGFKRTGTPQDGDLGLVIFDGRMCIAIHAGPIWFSRHADGLIGAPLNNIWKAWAV